MTRYVHCFTLQSEQTVWQRLRGASKTIFTSNCKSRLNVIRKTDSDRTISTAISASTEVDYCCFTSKSSIFLCSKIFLVHMWLISTEFDLKSASLLMKSQKISPSNRANVIGELMCFFGLSCKFYWVFSFVTFAQKHKFIRMTQILRYL